MLGFIIALAGQLGGANFNFKGNKDDFNKFTQSIGKKSDLGQATQAKDALDVSDANFSSKLKFNLFENKL